MGINITISPTVQEQVIDKLITETRATKYDGKWTLENDEYVLNDVASIGRIRCTEEKLVFPDGVSISHPTKSYMLMREIKLAISRSVNSSIQNYLQP